MARIVKLEDASDLPLWRRPIALLFLMAFAMPIAFATWSALLNNFVIEVGGFNGSDNGWLHTVREIPGFLAVGVIAIIIFVREVLLPSSYLCASRCLGWSLWSCWASPRL